MITLQNIYKHYCIGHNSVNVLTDISLQINDQEFSAIMGPSGSGKSTLMNILGLLDTPSSGHYFFLSQDVSQLDNESLAIMRNQMIGFIFQSFMLLPRMSLIENVSLPLLYKKVAARDRVYKSQEMLDKVGLLNFANRKPTELSGGQQQRVAIARALVTQPKIIFADEPTGALDSQTGQEIFSLLKSLNENQKTTIIIVTHDKDIANRCQRIINIQDGRIL